MRPQGNGKLRDAQSSCEPLRTTRLPISLNRWLPGSADVPDQPAQPSGNLDGLPLELVAQHLLSLCEIIV